MDNEYPHWIGVWMENGYPDQIAEISVPNVWITIYSFIAWPEFQYDRPYAMLRYDNDDVLEIMLYGWQGPEQGGWGKMSAIKNIIGRKLFA